MSCLEGVEYLITGTHKIWSSYGWSWTKLNLVSVARKPSSFFLKTKHHSLVCGGIANLPFCFTLKQENQDKTMHLHSPFKKNNFLEQPCRVLFINQVQCFWRRIGTVYICLLSVTNDCCQLGKIKTNNTYNKLLTNYLYFSYN